MTDYFYDMDLVVDPLNPSNVVANGLVSIYDPADTAGVTLLALKDPSGLPLPNPLPSNANGFLPPRIATVPQTMWKSGGFTGYFNSYKGLRDESVAAVTAAQSAANDASTAAAQVVTTATVDGSGALVLTKASGATVNAGNVKGQKGDKGDKGDKGLDGSNVLPTDDAIKQAINDTASATRGALNATYEPKGAAATAAAPKLDKTEAATTYLANSGARINDVGATAALMQNLDAAGSSCAIQVLGDSTGVSTTRWVYLMAQYLASQYPAFTVRHRFWNDGTQLYDAPTTLQTGPGGNRYAQFISGQNAWLYITNSAALNITADLDVSAQVALDDWTPAAAQAIVGRFNSAGTRSWMLRVTTTGNLELTWSNDGTATSAATSTVAPTVADGATLWVRVTLDVDNGASGRDIKFYTSTDGAAWTQLGATVTQATVTTIFNAAYRMELGARSNGSDYLLGKLYEIRIRNGINGPTIVPVSPELWEPATNAGGKITWGGAPVLDVINGSRSGANIYFLNDVVREPIMTPQYTTLLTFLSCSHNDSTRMGPQYLGDWDNLLATVKSRLPMSSIVVVGQNPRATPADVIPQHAARLAQLAGWSTRNGARFVNVYRAFMDYLAANPAVTLTSLLDNLGIHPTDAAYSTIYWPAIRSMFERRS